MLIHYEHDRRKRCVDNTFPSCGTCVRLNLLCKRDPVRDVTVHTSKHRSVSCQSGPTHGSSQKTHAQVAPIVSGSIVFSPEERHAYRYYSSVLVYHLTVSERFNSFLTGTYGHSNENCLFLG